MPPCFQSALLLLKHLKVIWIINLSPIVWVLGDGGSLPLFVVFGLSPPRFYDLGIRLWRRSLRSLGWKYNPSEHPHICLRPTWGASRPKLLFFLVPGFPSPHRWHKFKLGICTLKRAPVTNSWKGIYLDIYRDLRSREVSSLCFAGGWISPLAYHFATGLGIQSSRVPASWRGLCSISPPWRV